jgi:hypothetical protein
MGQSPACTIEPNKSKMLTKNDVHALGRSFCMTNLLRRPLQEQEPFQLRRGELETTKAARAEKGKKTVFRGTNSSRTTIASLRFRKIRRERGFSCNR